MTINYKAYSPYNQAVTKTKQIVMLYDGAMSLVKQAKEAILKGNVEERYFCIEKASSIVMGLQSSLDFDNGGEIAKVLEEYYSTIHADLVDIQKTNNPTLCDAVIDELKEMRSSWQSIDEGSSGSSGGAKQDAGAGGQVSA